MIPRSKGDTRKSKRKQAGKGKEKQKAVEQKVFICVEYVTSNALMNVFVVTYVIHGITSFACRLMGMKRSLMMIGTVILVKMLKNCLYLKPCSFIYDSGLWSYS